MREVWFQGRVLTQLGAEVLIVDIVADSDELLSMVGASDEDHGHSHGIGLWDEGWVGGICLGKHMLGLSTNALVLSGNVILKQCVFTRPKGWSLL